MLNVQREGRIAPEVAHALFVAALAAYPAPEWPELEAIAWSGHDEYTRVLGSDSYRVIAIDVPRAHHGIKPGAGVTWGLRAAAVRAVCRTNAVRAGEQAITVTHSHGRRGKVRVALCAGKRSHDATVARGRLFPACEHILDHSYVPRWRAVVDVREAAELFRNLNWAYSRQPYGARCILTPEPDGLAVVPSISARLSAGRWPAQWIGGVLAGEVDVREDGPVAMDAALIAAPLSALVAGWPDAETCEISITPEHARVFLTTESVRGRATMVVAPMQLGEWWPIPISGRTQLIPSNTTWCREHEEETE